MRLLQKALSVIQQKLLSHLPVCVAQNQQLTGTSQSFKESYALPIGFKSRIKDNLKAISYTNKGKGNQEDRQSWEKDPPPGPENQCSLGLSFCEHLPPTDCLRVSKPKEAQACFS